MQAGFACGLSDGEQGGAAECALGAAGLEASITSPPQAKPSHTNCPRVLGVRRMRERVWMLGLTETTGAGQQLEPLTKPWIHAGTHTYTYSSPKGPFPLDLSIPPLPWPKSLTSARLPHTCSVRHPAGFSFEYKPGSLVGLLLGSRQETC